MLIASQSSSLSRVVPRAFEETLNALRSALEREGLQIICEVPFHREFQKSMGVTCRRYTVFVVWSQFETWRAVLTEDNAGLLMPFNIAVMEAKDATQITVNNWVGRHHHEHATVGVSMMVRDAEIRIQRVFAACDPVRSSAGLEA